MKDSMTTPLSTATPDSAMNPTPAEIDSGIPRNASAATPPVSASGTPGKTIAASRTDPNSMNSRSEEHTSELLSLMRLSYAVFCLKNKNQPPINNDTELDAKCYRQQ